MKTFQTIAEEIRAAQIYPSKIRVEPNDKMTNTLFSLTDREYQIIHGGKKDFPITEAKTKKLGTVKSSFRIRSDSKDQPSEFDHAVFNVCCSEIDAGNLYTTPSIIYRALTGKIGDSDANPSKNQIAAIRQSITKLRRIDFMPDVKDAFDKLGYEDVTLKIQEASVLPCVVLDAFINGQEVNDAIYFLCEPPALAIAKAKDQILRYDAALLNIPDLNNTPLTITLKNYVVHRVLEVKVHKMTPSLTFDDIFKKARISDASKHAKFDARETVEKFFAHLQTQGVIKTFALVKQGAKFHAVTFTY